MTLSQGLPGDRPLWLALLRVVKTLMEEALLKAEIPTEDVRWTERRWDVPDITASWPKDRGTRNLHAWIRGSWPRFFLEVEGAAWQDDEKRLERRVRLLPFPNRPGVLIAEGLASSPEVAIPNKEDLEDGLYKLASDLKAARLNYGATTHRLQPNPRLTQL